MLSAEGPSSPSPGGGGARRSHRVEELRARIDRLRERIAESQAEQRRAVMELAELLEETRRMARRAQQEQRTARWREARARADEAPDDGEP
ncbi:MAG: hypothetical protein ACRD2C_25335 [Acidimicrobiales bacterium]